MVLLSGASLIRFIRWQSEVLTKKEHKEICAPQQEATMAAWGEIKNTLKKQDEESSAWRSKFDDKMDENHKQNQATIGAVKDSVAAMRTDVQVLKTRVDQIQPSTTVNIQGA